METSSPTRDQLAAALAELGYQLEKEIGQGGSATVFRVRDTKHNRQVALKILRPEVADAIELERFNREVSLAAQLAHPHILPLYDSGMTFGLPFYVTPLIEGRTLRDRLHGGPVPPGEAARIATGIAEALDFAHRRGVVHRDIKPENVLLAGGEAVVADFGIATALDAAAHRPDPSASGRRLTSAGLVVGTPDYMSPEQAAGESIDGRADIFALGCVLFEMLSGRVPFGGETYSQMLADRLRSTSKRIVQDLEGVPPVLAAIAARCLMPAPDARFPSAQALADALRGETDALGPALEPASRFRRPLVLGAALIGVGMLAVAWLFSKSPDLHRIVVLPLTNETNDSTLAPVGSLAEKRIAAALSTMPGIDVVISAVDVPSFRAVRHRADSEAAPAPPADGLERLRSAAAEAEAGVIVSGSYYRVRDSLELILEITEVRSGRLLRAIGPIHGVPSAVDSLIGSVVGEVRSAVDSLIVAPRSR